MFVYLFCACFECFVFVVDCWYSFALRVCLCYLFLLGFAWVLCLMFVDCADLLFGDLLVLYC